jgi:ABC-2 type transport system ATP-binding protein
MTLAVETHAVTKKFPGVGWALQGVDLSLEPGHILGFLGPNGSGKSTFLKILAGIQRATSGQVLVLGLSPGIVTKRRAAYLPEIDHLYRWMTARDAIRFMLAFYKDFDANRASRLLQSLDVPPGQAFGQLSRGQRARLKLVLTLARQADLLLLDEPLSGIDLLSRDRILNAILAEYRIEDQAIIMATHQIAEAEALFDRVAFIRDGRVLLEGAADDLRAARGRSIEDIYREEFA